MTPTPKENTALVRRFLTDVVAGNDHDALEAFVADDAVDHNLVFGDSQPRATTAAVGQSALAAVGDVDLEIQDIVAAGDTVAVRTVVSGTHQGSLLDLAPTGHSVEIAYVWFFCVEEGRIAEVWSLPDGLGLVQQLDAIPESNTD